MAGYAAPMLGQQRRFLLCLTALAAACKERIGATGDWTLELAARVSEFDEIGTTLR